MSEKFPGLDIQEGLSPEEIANLLRNSPHVVGVWDKLDPHSPSTRQIVFQYEDQTCIALIFPRGETMQAHSGKLLARSERHGYPIRTEFFQSGDGTIIDLSGHEY